MYIHPACFFCTGFNSDCMRILFTFYFIVLCSVYGKSQNIWGQTKSDLDESQAQSYELRSTLVRNNIHTVKGVYQNYRHGKECPLNHLSYEAGYNDGGYCTSYKTFSKQGKIRSTYTYSWDENGNNLESQSGKASGKLNWKYTNRYDEAGNNIQVTKYWKSKSKPELIWINSFDQKRNMIKMEVFSGDQKELYGKYVFTYFEDGSKKQTQEFNRKGKLLHTWNYECKPTGELEYAPSKDSSRVCVHFETDQAGNKIKIKEEFLKDGKTARIITKSDQNNNLLEKVTYDKNGKELTRVKKQYNNAGKVTESTQYKKGSKQAISKEVFKYDASGLVNEVQKYKKLTTPEMVWKYEYATGTR